MTDRLLRKNEIAAILGTGPGVAASILANMGVQPIDFGFGRGRGPRWLESAVMEAIQSLHRNAQPVQTSAKKQRSTSPVVSLASASVAQIYELTSSQCVQ